MDKKANNCGSKKGFFVCAAEKTALLAGQPLTFLLALGIIGVWALTGPVFAFGDTWQLIINTGTTIITFLMVFLIQNTQNRDARAVQIKLDELIRATKGAHTVLLDLEELSDEELREIHKKYELLAQEAREKLRSGGNDIDIPEVILEDADKQGGDRAKD